MVRVDVVHPVGSDVAFRLAVVRAAAGLDEAAEEVDSDEVVLVVLAVAAGGRRVTFTRTILDRVVIAASVSSVVNVVNGVEEEGLRICRQVSRSWFAM